MANLYSAYVSAGQSAGKYKASLFETSNWADKFDFIGKQTAWEEEKTSRKVEAIGDTLELASTAYGGHQDKEKFETRAKAVGDKYGDMQPDTRDWGQKSLDFLSGKEQTYTFGEGESARTFSRAGVQGKGGMLLGESMYDEWFNKQEDGMSTEPIREIPKFDGMPKLEFAKSFASLFSKGNTQSNNDGSSDKSLDESFWFTDEESANLSSWK
jgi:hypothetical protein|tara:strand:+ start:898 stop:1533 length:636 start_codon:yes stop_codon:yes gene_type:complete